MPPFVGSVNCDYVKGEAPAAKTRVRTWYRDGINYVAAQDLGKGDAEFRFRCIYIDLRANVDTWIAAMQALQGTVQTINTDWNVAIANCLITRVGNASVIAVMDPNGAQLKARAEIEISGERRA